MAELLTATTLSTISALISITGTSIAGLRWSKDIMSGKNTDLNSKQSILLMERANSVGNVLKSVHPDILTRPIGHRIIQTLIDSMGWAIKYNKKHKIKKIFKFEKYRHLFRTYHRALSRDLADLSDMLTIYWFSTSGEVPGHVPAEFGLDEKETAALLDMEPDERDIVLSKPGKKTKTVRREVGFA